LTDTVDTEQMPENAALQAIHPLPFISEDKNSKSLHFSIDQLQSRMNIRQPEALELDYTRIMMGFLLLNQQPKHIAMIGLGGGSLAKFCHRNLPDTQITVVEINPHVIAIRQDFLVPEDSERFKVIEADGADFVRDADPDFDVLLVDGYDQQGQPPQLGSQQFYENCCGVLTDQGILVVNLHAHHANYDLYIDRINRSFDGNTGEVPANKEGNTVVFAAKNRVISAHGARKKSDLDAFATEDLKALKSVFQKISQTWQNPPA
jgi:spermidine synthase